MISKQTLIGAALGVAALVVYQRWLSRKLSGGGDVVATPTQPRNDAAGPRLPGLPPLPDVSIMQPVSGAVPNMPRMPSMPTMPNMPSMPALQSRTTGAGSEYLTMPRFIQ